MKLKYKMEPKYESLGVLWEGCQWCKEEGKTNLDPASLVLPVGDNKVYVACERHRGELKEKGDKNKIIDQSTYITAEDIAKYNKLKKLREEAAHPARIAPLYIESKGSVNKNETNCMIM